MCPEEIGGFVVRSEVLLTGARNTQEPVFAAKIADSPGL
jgi:hypothetical protein